MLIFKIMLDVYSGLLSFVRIYSGNIRQGGIVRNVRNNLEEKVIKLLRMHANLRTELNYVNFGDIVVICGIKHSITGDSLCGTNSTISLFAIKLPSPVIKIILYSIIYLNNLRNNGYREEEI